MSGDSDFLYRAGTILAPAGNINHLHIICNDPVFYPINGAISVLAVHISTVRGSPRYDGTCILRQGDHPFIRHDSFVYYQNATILKVERANVLFEERTLVPMEKLREEVFKRVLDGFSQSEKVTRRVLAFVRDYCS